MFQSPPTSIISLLNCSTAVLQDLDQGLQQQVVALLRVQASDEASNIGGRLVRFRASLWLLNS